MNCEIAVCEKLGKAPGDPGPLLGNLQVDLPSLPHEGDEIQLGFGPRDVAWVLVRDVRLVIGSDGIRGWIHAEPSLFDGNDAVVDALAALADEGRNKSVFLSNHLMARRKRK